jgi:hypothetical protein
MIRIYVEGRGMERDWGRGWVMVAAAAAPRTSCISSHVIGVGDQRTVTPFASLTSCGGPVDLGEGAGGKRGGEGWKGGLGGVTNPVREGRKGVSAVHKANSIVFKVILTFYIDQLVSINRLFQ